MTYSPENPYTQSYFPGNEKETEKHNLSVISMLCGGAVVAFVAIEILISILLSRSNAFLSLYNSDRIFSNAFNSLLSIIAIAGSFYIAFHALKRRNLVGTLPLGTPYDKGNFMLLIPACIMICFIGSFASSMLSAMVNAWFGIELSQPDDISSYTTLSGVLMSVMMTAIIPAFIEEFAIRGVVMQSLRRYGDKFAIVMSALVFALMHGNMIQIPFAFIAGIAIGYAVIKTGTMWTGIIIHFINNFLAVMSMTAYDNISQIKYAVVTVVLYAIVFIPGIICVIKFSKKTPYITQELSRGSCRCLSTGEKTTRFIFTVPMLVAIGILVYETSLYIN